MYRFSPPKPIEISLAGPEGFRIREKAAEYVAANPNTTGAQRGSTAEQSYGALAEIVIRGRLGLPEINPENHPLGFDLLLPSGVKVDIKCRGGEKPFSEEYEGGDGLPREAKHNFFARQLIDERLDTDIYLMTHLRRPKVKEGTPVLPGKPRQRVWVLYVCGWVSKARVLREGVYLPPGAISERGREWFAYRADEVEFYNRNLNGFADLSDLLTIDQKDVLGDAAKIGDLNLTRVDTLRIGYDLAGRGLLKPEHVAFIKKEMALGGEVNSFLHVNQSAHVIKWLYEKGGLTEDEYQALAVKLPEIKFLGLGK